MVNPYLTKKVLRESQAFFLQWLCSVKYIDVLFCILKLCGTSPSYWMGTSN